MNDESGRPARSFALVGIGEVLWDLLPEGKQLGGAPANFAYQADALGATGVIVSCVGRDESGTEILTRLGQLGLDTSYIAVDSEHPTGSVSVILKSCGKPHYVIHENVAWDYIPEDPSLFELAGRADAVCFGSLCQRSPASRVAIRGFLRACRAECIRVFDINLRQSYFDRDVVHESLELADVFKLNDEELPVVAELFSIRGSEGATVSLLADRYNLRLVAVTKGEYGSTLYSPGNISRHKGFKGPIVDTIGAGDAFTAAMTLGLLRGDALDQISEDANRVAGYVCTQVVAMPKLAPELFF